MKSSDKKVSFLSCNTRFSSSALKMDWRLITPIISPSSWQVLRSWDWNHIFRANLEMFLFHIGLHCSLYIVSYQGCQILEREEEEIKNGLSIKFLPRPITLDGLLEKEDLTSVDNTSHEELSLKESLWPRKPWGLILLDWGTAREVFLPVIGSILEHIEDTELEIDERLLST